MINIGIIGLGSQGLVHLKILSNDERVRIVGVCDVVEEKAKHFARKYHTKMFTDYKKLVEDPEVEGVFVTVPNALHTEVVLYAAEKGVHIFEEKPMATNLTDAKRILDKIKERGVSFQIGHMGLFMPLFKKVKEMMEKKEINPYLVDIMLNRGELRKPSWVEDPKISGGFLYETAIHALYLARWLMGEAREVYCVAKANIYQQLNDFVITLELENERLVSLTCSGHSSWAFPIMRMNFIGDHSILTTVETTKILFTTGLEKGTQFFDFCRLPFEVAYGYVEEDKHFINALTGKQEIIPDVNEGYKTVELIEVCYRSARKHAPVKLPLV